MLLILFLIFIVYLLYLITTWKFNYWKSHKVPHLPPTPLLGNYGNYILMRKFYGQVTQEICQKFPNAPYVGAYYGTEPTLILQDPELIKLITIKDFYYFNSREVADHTHKEVTTQNLFFSYGDSWKAVRQHMTSLFSSVKMRNMFPLIEKCSYSFEDYLNRETGSSDVVDVRSLMTRFTMACICSCVFGTDVDTLGENCKDNPFIRIGHVIFQHSYIRGFLTVSRAIWPTIFYGLGLKSFPDEMSNFFKTFVTSVLEAREYKQTSRNDFVDLILNLKMQKSISAECLSNVKTGRNDKIELPVTDDFLVAQCVLFFGAGYETSSTGLTFVLYELAKKPEVQECVLKEIDEYLLKNGNKLGYECMTELPYTQASVDEALRLHPALGVLTRELVENYTMPDGLQLDKV